MLSKPNRKPLFSVTLEDCEVQTFSTGGKGGQNQNKREMGIRIVHKASGAVGECREERHQWANKKRAFHRMAEHPKFKAWHRLECAKRMGQKTPEELTEEAMAPENLRIEVRKDGVWEAWSDSETE